jgi:hypothetical protein
MSGPPPNYDPNTSMLHGGTNSVIQPVMGGGGNAPPNYNPENSLLAGGTEQILKVLGGGAKTKGNLQGEVYSIPESEETKKFREDYLTNILNPANEYLEKRQELNDNLLYNFMETRLKKIKRYDTNEVAQDIILPTIQTVQNAGGGVIPNLPSVYDIIPADIETLVVLPPMNGDIEKFVKAIQYLFKTQLFRKETTSDLRLKDGIAIVCLSPFYAQETQYDAMNNMMYYLHLRLWQSNPNSFFVLNSFDAFSSGLNLYNDLQPGYYPVEQFPVPNCLNPSYVICNKPFGKYKGILFTSQFGQIMEQPRKNKNQGFRHPSELLGKQTTFASIPSSAMEDAEQTFKDYLIIGAQKYKADLIKSRSDVPLCKNLLTVFYDEDVVGNYILSDSREEIHVFRYDVVKEEPLLCIDETGRASKLAPPPGDFAGREKHPKYVKALTKNILVNATIHKIREDSSGVYINWTEGIYSKEEADFLNSLQLNPTLLHFVFDINWKVEVANFLKKIVLSDCFKDVQLLTKAECDSTRVFLDRILDYFYAHAVVRADDTPIQKMVLPKYVEKEDIPAFLEPAPPQVLPQRQIPPIGFYVWPGNIVDINPKDFDKESFGVIKKQIDGDNYYVDFIAVQKESGIHLFKRFKLDKNNINEEALRRGVSKELIIKEKLLEQADLFTDFIFIY